MNRIDISLSRNLLSPNLYVGLMNGEFSPWAFNEERAPKLKGHWREEAFEVAPVEPMDLEIGTGNGNFFAHRATKFPSRNLVGIELKYKPLIQSIRRALNAGAKNARIARYDAFFLEDLFEPGEINDVFIHFPDPWEGRTKWVKNRLVRPENLEMLFRLQRPGSTLEFKTDSLEYFDWAEEHLKNSPYKVEYITRDLHQSEWAKENFVTHFESLFLKKGQPIYAARLAKS